MTPKLVLTYFDFDGSRGEVARLAMHVADIPFEDRRIARKDWAALRDSTPFQAVPTLEVDGNVINNARILGASRWRILTSIVLPSATTWILSSLHTAFGFALIGAVVGEYAGASKGLGLLISNSQGTFDAAGIYAGMIIITVAALIAEWAIGLAESRLLKWRPSQANSNSHGI